MHGIAKELTSCVAKVAGARLVLSAHCSACIHCVKQAVCSDGTAGHGLDALLCRSIGRRSHAPLQIAGLRCPALVALVPRGHMAAAAAAAA